MGLNLKNRIGTGRVICMTVLLVSLGGITTASSNAVVPDDQKALLTVRGQGVTPFAQVSLSTGPKQTITTKADGAGQFMFSNLKYASFTNLKFSLDIPPYEKGLAQNYPANHLEFKYNAKESMANLSGQIGKYGTLAFHLAGAPDGTVRFAGQEGYVALQTRTATPMSSGQSTLTASIVNAGEVCCPKMIIPANPITLTILSQPMASAPPVAVPPQKKETNIPAIVRPSTMPVAPKSETTVPPVNNGTPPSKPVPYILMPKDQNSPQKDDQKPKTKVPYIIQGRIDIAPTVILSDEVIAATSFSSADYDATYVGGAKNGADSGRNSMMLKVGTLGAFFDARTLLDTLRSLQMSAAQTLKNYTASEAICKFGTMSRSVASADAVAKKNQLAFSKIMMDRNNQKEGTVYAKAGMGMSAMINDFKEKYCFAKDNNTFLDGYCKAATATSDLLYNRDVDFTRVFDVPLTLDADFSADGNPTNDQQSVIALFGNLSLIPPLMNSGSEEWDPRSNSLKTQDIRALESMRAVSANSFAALVGEKAKSTAEATSYMKEMIVQLGLTSAEAGKLLGSNPSYFAQMEVLTKKLFQNPAFYANLYDSEANVDRQRVAMKAIELQQDRDFLESLRRREMLLSILLNAKLRETASRDNQSGVVRQ